LKKNTFIAWPNWSLKKKLLAFTSILILLSVTVVSILTYSRYTTYFTQQSTRQTEQIIEQIGINLDTYMDELFRLSVSPYYNSEIMAALETDAQTDLEKLTKRRMIENFLGGVMTLPRNDILRVYIVTEDGAYSSNRTTYDIDSAVDNTGSDWYLRAVETSDPIFLPVHTESGFREDNIQIFSIVLRLRSTRDNSKILGVIKVDANYSGIKSICDKIMIREGSALFVTDTGKNIVYKNSRLGFETDSGVFFDAPIPEENNSITMKSGADKYIVSSQPMTTTDWRIVEVNSVSALNQYFTSTRNAAFFLALLCAMLAVFISIFFVNSFLRPLFQIVNLMRQVQEGNLKTRYDIKNHDEIGYLGESFNQMIDRIDSMMERNTQLIKEVYEVKYLQKEAQYNALCSQIKPHFLYNTLNTISLLIKCNEPQKAVEDIGKLSFLLRGIMNIDKEIPVSEELKIVDAYLSLQKSRYGKNLQYEIDIDESFSSYLLPALTLQPIVENAVIHGCEATRGESLIRLYSSTDSESLYFHVTDNGGGISPEKLVEIKTKLAECQKIESTGNGTSGNAASGNGASGIMSPVTSGSIGLINVNRRIKLKYGEPYGISIQSEAGLGTHVTLHLPLFSEVRS